MPQRLRQLETSSDVLGAKERKLDVYPAKNLDRL